jgi:autotransporter-associated beta strand protein
MKKPRLRRHQTLTVQATLVSLTLLVAVGLDLLTEARAADRIWVGKNPTTSNWRDVGNWYSGIPVGGDTLRFEADYTYDLFTESTSRHTNTNDYSAGAFHAIIFRPLGFAGLRFYVVHYALWGNALRLTNGIQAIETWSPDTEPPTNVIQFDLAIPVSQTFLCETNAYLFINGDLSLSNIVLALEGEGEIRLAGAIAGPGGLTKNGTGNLWLRGTTANSFTGTTTVNAGTLFLNKSYLTPRTAVSGRLVVGDNVGGAEADVVQWMQDNQVANASGITVNRSGLLGLNGHSDTIGWLNLAGGRVDTGGGTLTLNGNLTNAYSTVQATFSGRLSLGNSNRIFSIANGTGAPDLLLEAAVIEGGSPAGFTKTGAGTLTLAGVSDNSYTGDTVVNAGVLELAKNNAVAIAAGVITIGDNLGGAEADVLRVTTADQIANSVPIIINSSGLLDVTDQDERVGLLTFNGGEARSDAAMLGTLILGGDVTVNASSNGMALLGGRVSLPGTRVFDTVGHILSPDMTISAAVLGAGGLTKNGTGELALTASNSYSGLTVVNSGTLHVEHDWALGTTNAGTVVGNDAALSLRHGAEVGKESLTLQGEGPASKGALRVSAGQSAWAGNITLAANTIIAVAQATDSLTLRGSVSGTGRLEKTSLGTLVFEGAGANTYAGATVVSGGRLSLEKSAGNAIPGDLNIGSGAEVQISDRGQVNDQAAVTVDRSGILRLVNLLTGQGEIVGSLSGRGEVKMEMAILSVGRNNTSTTFTGPITGSGGLIKDGIGTFTLHGTNTYTGPTAVGAGAMLVNGVQPQSSVTVSAGATLGGSGTVGNITVSGGTLAPGASAGILTCSNVAFSSSSTFAVELNGTTPGSGLQGHDQLNVRGTVALSNATLTVSVGFTPSVGDTFILIQNDLVDTVNGTFKDLPNGATFKSGLVEFRILYDGASGTANDVVLIVTQVASPPPLWLLPPSCTGTNLSLSWAGGAPAYVVEKKSELTTNASWTRVVGPQPDTNATVPMDMPRGFYRVRGGN